MAFRALLVGASDYIKPMFPSLPFIRNDLLRLQKALTDRQFASAEIVEGVRGVTRTEVNAQVGDFLRAARSGDRLLIVLSGHGFHFEGFDYLVPEDGTAQIEPLSDSCVRIGWERELDECHAAQVVFLVDACREGVEWDTKAQAPGLRGWGAGKNSWKVASAGRRKVACVYACSPGEVARYVRRTGEPDDAAEDTLSFSLFSRAVCDVVAELPHSLDLSEFVQQVQDRMDRLHAHHALVGTKQRVHTVVAVGHEGGFDVLPGTPRRTDVHRWLRAVETHPVWELTYPQDKRGAVKEMCAALAGRLAAAFDDASRALSDDPWHDPGLIQRISERMRFAIGLVKDIRFSPTEAVLVVLLPLLDQVFWTREAARRTNLVRGGAEGPEHDAFALFHRGYPRLERRLQTLEEAVGTKDADIVSIRWWLFHRWLIQQPGMYSGESLQDLLDTLFQDDDPEWPYWAKEVLTCVDLLPFLKGQRTAPFAVAWAGQPSVDVVAASTGDEHEVRRALVSALVKVARALAVDSVDLSETIVEHLGIYDRVALTELAQTLAQSNWRAAGLGRSLNAVCQHPAVQDALRQHAERTDTLLRDINRDAALKPLHGLPPYADADHVTLSGKTPERLSSGIRFTLAEDRVQELLMGDSLYGERELAIRELYQNALDALRYREARTRYLCQTTDDAHRLGEWTGEIAFKQDVGEDGRPFLECRDNGIGMGMRELSGVFAQGGVRFVDLPEYIEEEAEWSKAVPKIELFPNSRFGIGVLSYFMLANEIDIDTCRMARDGRPGRLLRVRIAGPGNIFRVEDLGRGRTEDVGTRVRLYLTRSAAEVSCTATLNKLLWVAPFRTTAQEGTRSLVRGPGEIPQEVLERHRAVASGLGEARRSLAVVKSNHPDLWWIDGKGVLLADGILTDTAPGEPGIGFGLIVNLQGPHRPDLSVDRRRIRGYDRAYFVDVALDAAEHFVEQRPAMLTPDWLTEVADHFPRLADKLVDLAAERRVPCRVREFETRFDLVGLFPPDRLILPAITGEVPTMNRDDAAAWIRNLPPAILRWRILAFCRAGLGGAGSAPARIPIPNARPSDLELLSPDISLLGYGDRFDSWRLNEMRMLFGGPANISSPIADMGVYAHNELIRWRPPQRTVSVAEVMYLSQRRRQTPGAMANRLTALGYEVDRLGNVRAATVADRALVETLAERFHRPSAPPVPSGQILYSAVRTRSSTASVARRLEELGYEVPAGYPVRDGWSDDELALMADFGHLFLSDVARDDFQSDLRREILLRAVRDHSTVGSIVGDLRALGLAVPEAIDATETVSAGDRALLKHVAELNLNKGAISRFRLHKIAVNMGRPSADVAERLRSLGFQAPDPLPEDDPEFKRAFAMLRRVSDYTLYEPISVFDVSEIAYSSGRPVGEVFAALDVFGLRYIGDPDFLSRLQREAPTAFPIRGLSTPAEIDPARLYAIAHMVSRTRDDLAPGLAAMGFEVAPADEDFERDVWAERELEQSLSSMLGKSLHPALIRYAGAEAPPFLGRPDRISLSALTAVAVRRGASLRTMAVKAAYMGLRHEAETWFDPTK